VRNEFEMLDVNASSVLALMMHIKPVRNLSILLFKYESMDFRSVMDWISLFSKGTSPNNTSVVFES
jgi:hypothetical protein